MEVFDFHPTYNIITLDECLYDAITYNKTVLHELKHTNDLSVVLFNTDKQNYHQRIFDHNKIECINSCTVESFEEARSVLKLDYIYESLKKVTSKYVLLILNENGFVVKLDDIVEKFKKQEKKVLFASQRQKYGVLNFTFDEVQTFMRYNTDYCIGETKSVLYVFEKLAKARQILNIEHYMERHENDFINTALNGFVRSLIDNINQSKNDDNLIGLDYNELIFKDYSKL